MDAHAPNRTKGINMAHYQWPAERIKESLGNQGKMLVALSGKELAGTAAIADKTGKAWYTQGRFAYMCFAGVRPEYNGRGIYTELLAKREEIAGSSGYKVFVFDTHCKNKRIQKIARRKGYRYVRFFRASNKEHYSVVMAKWPDSCPYSEVYCFIKFMVSVVRTLFSDKVLHR